MIKSIINVKATNAKIRKLIKALEHTEQNLCALGVTVTNVSFSGIENLIVMSHNNVKQ
jgi:hypothetical protein